MDELLVDFLTETNESLADLDLALVTLERSPEDRDTLSLIFRLMHTIKGTCGFLGLPRLERVAHAAENILVRMRDGALAATPSLISLVLAALDRIKEILAGLAQSGTEPAEAPGAADATLIAALNAAAEGGAAEPVASEAPAEPVMMAEPVAEPVVAEPVARSAAAEPAARAAPEAAHEPSAGNQTIRVGVEVLEHLMTLVSELVLTRNQLLQLARSQQQDSFTVPLQRLSQITSDLQEGVMKTRMQPIGNAWNKLPRLVRDLSHELGKKIELIMRGAETELDRQVLELIKDPLTHMVRNSGDHGLETPAERRAAGKPETGHITLTAYHEGGHIIIEIGDDGRGLPVDRIRAKALAQGLATEAEIAGMSDNEIQRFIFRAGFSTAASITAVSGRGVGMDVVKTNIEKIGGAIGLKSTPGAGTVFTIKIPLTLAIVSALIVESAGERFAIPQISVVELVRAGEAGSAAAQAVHTEAPPGQAKHEEAAQAEVERINDTPVLRLRDRLLPLVNLRDLLRLDAAQAAPSDAPAQDAATPRAAVHIVVTQMGAATLGIIVDRVFDTEEIVVKPVAPILRDITMFSGNTILGDGSVIMILDPNGIARASGMSGGESRGQSAAPAETASSSDSIAVLLFRAGDAAPKAVPLALVARLEDIPRARIETAGGRLVTQYRGQLMPLESMGGEMLGGEPAEGASQPVLVFNDRGRSMGLMVDEIVDVVESPLHMELAAARPGILGTAVIAGQASDVIDTGYWLLQAFGDWFRDGGAGGGDVPSGGRQPHILVVDDSDFFRHLLVPVLSAAGYRVSAAGDAAHALALRDAGEAFDAIISDIEMPEMNGLAFARAVRAEPSWANVPLIALSGRANPADVAAGHAAGFTDYVAKFDRAALLESLRQCFAPAQPV